jgi:RNA polymerase sigma factor (sigma-70 family)
LRSARFRHGNSDTVASVSPERFTSLLAAAREGSEAAWQELYDGLAPVVLGYLRANAAPDPEDVLSEVFLQVARDVARFEGNERGFRSWVFTIAHHRLIDARRRSARRPVELSAQPPENGDLADDAADEALANIGMDEVKRVLAALSPEQRSVLLLRVVGDMSIEDVAKAVGKRTGAVKALQRRGLAAVKRELETQGVPL